jgi:hypothetical protein
MQIHVQKSLSRNNSYSTIIMYDSHIITVIILYTDYILLYKKLYAIKYEILSLNIRIYANKLIISCHLHIVNIFKTLFYFQCFIVEPSERFIKFIIRFIFYGLL